MIIISACAKPVANDISLPEERPDYINFSRVTEVHRNGVGHRSPKVAADNAGNVYVSWNQVAYNSSEVRLKKSSNRGNSFFQDLGFHDAERGELGLKPFVDTNENGHVFLIWSDTRDSICYPDCPGFKIYFAKSTDGGLHFTDNIPTGSLATDDRMQTSGLVEVAGDGTIYVVWNEFVFSEDRDYIYISISNDGGATFSLRKRVYDQPLTRSIPAMTIDINNHLYIAWTRYSEDNKRRIVELIKSTDMGATFSAPVQVYAGDVVNEINRNAPSLATDIEGNLYIAWTGEENSRYVILTSLSTNGGASFSTPVRVDNSQGATGNQEKPAIVMTGDGVLYVTWQDLRYGQIKIHASASSNSGASFGEAIIVDNSDENTAAQLDPWITADNENNIYIVWADSGREGVYLVKGSIN